METTLADTPLDSFVFDPASPAFDEDPYPFYQYLRENAPVYWWAKGRAWVVTRYEDVVACLHDKRLSLDPAYWEHAEKRTGAAALLIPYSLIGLSDEAHARVRRLVNPAVASQRIEKMRPEIQAIVDAALAGFEGKDQVDMVQDFAERIPFPVLSRLLDIPAAQEQRFRHFGIAVAESVASTLPRDQLDRVMAVIMDGVGMIQGLIEERRLRPGGDLLSTLIHFEEQGDKLNAFELLCLVAALLLAGADTTMHSLCRAVLNLLRQPDQRRLVMDDPSLVRKAFHEVLRFDNFAKGGPPRYTKEDLTIGGTSVRKGQMVFSIRQSAMRDPAAYADPDTFDVRREMGKSLAFGSGPHVCIGAALAQLQAEVALDTLLNRYPEMSLAGRPTYEQHPFIRKMVSMPVRLHA